MLFKSYSHEILHEQFHWTYLQKDIKLLLVTVNNTLKFEIEIVHDLSFHSILRCYSKRRRYRVLSNSSSFSAMRRSICWRMLPSSSWALAVLASSCCSAASASSSAASSSSFSCSRRRRILSDSWTLRPPSLSWLVKSAISSTRKTTAVRIYYSSGGHTRVHSHSSVSKFSVESTRSQFSLLALYAGLNRLPVGFYRSRSVSVCSLEGEAITWV